MHSYTDKAKHIYCDPRYAVGRSNIRYNYFKPDNAQIRFIKTVLEINLTPHKPAFLPQAPDFKTGSLSIGATVKDPTLENQV